MPVATTSYLRGSPVIRKIEVTNRDKVIARLSCGVLAVVLAIFAAGCKGGVPTTPTGTPLPSAGEAFEVSGVVTDEEGVPVAGASVTMRFYLAGVIKLPSVVTDASGSYTIRFTANPWMSSTSGRVAARAEIIAEGYDWYWRSVLATIPSVVENFRLHRIKRITAGDSIVLSITPDNGECTGWLVGPCGRLRVAALADGNLTLEAVPTQLPAGLPQIELCCVAGNEVGGNPVSLPVRAGTELWVEVGQPPGNPTGGSVMVKTSFEPF
jgi:hypothetical protein